MNDITLLLAAYTIGLLTGYIWRGRQESKRKRVTEVTTYDK